MNAPPKTPDTDSDQRSLAPVKKRLGRPPATDNQRERILQAAAQLFAERGYEASSVGDLAQAMGISKAGIYHYFASKQDIYDAIILDVLTQLNARVQEAVGAQEHPSEQLKAFMVTHAQTFETHYHAFTTMLVGFSGMAGAGLRDEAIRQRDAYEALLRSIMKQGQLNGEFTKADPATAARAVLSMLNWMARWFKPNGSACAQSVALDYYHLILHGLAAVRQDALS